MGSIRGANEAIKTSVSKGTIVESGLFRFDFSSVVISTFSLWFLRHFLA